MSIPPLTTVLRRVGWFDNSLPPREGQHISFLEVSRNAFGVLRKEATMERFHVDQTGITLFGALPNSYLRHIVKDNANYFGPSGSGWSYASQLTPSFRRFLLRKLFWFNGLKDVHKYKLYDYCETPQKFQKLSNLFQTVEGRVIAALLSVGDRVTYDEIDQLNRSIIGNLLNDSRFQKKMKTYLKQVRKSVLEGNKIPSPSRETSFLKTFINKCLDGNLDRDETIYRIVTFCQGRAMGNPSRDLIHDSAQKWVENFTKPDPNGPEDYNLDELEVQVMNTPLDVEAIRAHARVTLSHSACFEAGRKQGGKISVAREILKIPLIRKIDLESGEDSKEVIAPRDSPGEALFHYSLWKMRDYFEDSMQVKASNVNEGGAKSRVVTADSFFHGSVLSPWAHMWLKILQSFPAARAGVTEGRHGWAFIKSITASRPDLAWVFEVAVKAISTDLSEATDHLYWSAAKALIRMCNRVLEIPEWYGRLIESCLCSPRYVSYRAGSFSWKGETSNGVFMGDSGCKVLLTFGNLLAVLRMAYAGNAVSAVVGDDHTTLSTNAVAALGIYNRTIRSLGFVTSDDDEVVSDTYGFYAEEVYKIPPTNRDTVDAIASGSPRELPYIDIPKVRLLMDIRKDRADFSSTTSGRVFQFGKELEYVNRPNRFQGLFHIGSWIQDLCLDLRHKPEFVYFPRALVSAGKPLLFQNRDNFTDFIKIHKSGRLLGRYYYLMDTAVHSQVNFGIVPRFFTKTSEDRLVLVKQRELPEQVVPLKLFQSRKKKWYQPLVVQRLREYLISETEICAKLNQLEELFSEVPVAEPATVESVAVSVEEINTETLKSFLDMWEGNSMLLGRNALENWYPRKEVMKILDIENPLHVKIPINWTGKKGGIPAERMLEKERDAARLYEWLLNSADDVNPPTEIIADDPAILEQIRDAPNKDVYVATDDVAMLRYASSLYWRKNVIRISTRRWCEAAMTITPLLGSGVQDSVIVDLGSVDSLVSQLTDEELDEIEAVVKPLTYDDLVIIRATHGVAPKEIREMNLLERIRAEEALLRL
jgi:hypothetical protein